MLVQPPEPPWWVFPLGYAVYRYAPGAIRTAYYRVGAWRAARRLRREKGLVFDSSPEQR